MHEPFVFELWRWACAWLRGHVGHDFIFRLHVSAAHSDTGVGAVFEAMRIVA